MNGKLIMALSKWLAMNQQQVAMAHSNPDRKPGKTASGYSFSLFHGYTTGHKVDCTCKKDATGVCKNIFLNHTD